MYGHIVRWSFKWSLMPINYWMLPGLARVSRMPRIAAEVEGMHPSSLEGLALHQRHSYKWSQWCRSLLGRLLCGTRGKWRSSQTIFQQPVTWRFQTTLPGFQKESHTLNQIMTKENDFLSLQHAWVVPYCLQNLKYRTAGKMKRLSRSSPREKVVNL